MPAAPRAGPRHTASGRTTAGADTARLVARVQDQDAQGLDRRADRGRPEAHEGRRLRRRRGPGDSAVRRPRRCARRPRSSACASTRCCTAGQSSTAPIAAEVDRTFAESQAALQTAQAFGAETVLLVPCRIGGPGAGGAGSAAGGPPLRMPRPWEFQIAFDPGHRAHQPGRRRRQRAVRRLHQGPQPRDRRVTRMGDAADPDRREDGRRRSRSRTCGTTSG